MTYRWKNDDIGVVQKYLKEKNDNKAEVTAVLIELVPTLKKEEIAIAIEIAEHQKLYEKGDLPLEKLRESEARLGLDKNKANRYHI